MSAMQHGSKSRTWLENQTPDGQIVGPLRFKQEMGGPIIFFPWSCWGPGYEVPNAITVTEILAKKEGRWLAILAILGIFVLLGAIDIACFIRRGHKNNYGWVWAFWTSTAWIYHYIRCKIVALRHFPLARLRLTHTELALAVSGHRTKQTNRYYWAGLVLACVSISGLVGLLYVLEEASNRSAITQTKFFPLGWMATVCIVSCATRDILKRYHQDFLKTSTLLRLDFFRWWDYVCLASFVTFVTLLFVR